MIRDATIKLTMKNLSILILLTIFLQINTAAAANSPYPPLKGLTREEKNFLGRDGENRVQQFVNDFYPELTELEEQLKDLGLKPEQRLKLLDDYETKLGQLGPRLAVLTTPEVKNYLEREYKIPASEIDRLDDAYENFRQDDGRKLLRLLIK